MRILILLTIILVMLATISFFMLLVFLYNLNRKPIKFDLPVIMEGESIVEITNEN